MYKAFQELLFLYVINVYLVCQFSLKVSTNNYKKFQ